MLIFFLYSSLNESLSWFPGSAHCSHRPEDKGQVTIPVYAWHLRFSFLRYPHHTCWIQDMGIICHDPYSPQYTQLPSVSVLTQLNFREWHCQRQTLSPGFPPPTLLSPDLSCYFKDVFSEQLSMRAVLGSSHTPVLRHEGGVALSAVPLLVSSVGRLVCGLSTKQERAVHLLLGTLLRKPGSGSLWIPSHPARL